MAGTHIECRVGGLGWGGLLYLHGDSGVSVRGDGGFYFVLDGVLEWGTVKG